MNSSNIYHVKCLVPNKHMKDFFFPLLPSRAYRLFQAYVVLGFTIPKGKKTGGVVMKSGRTDWLLGLSVCSVENGNRKEVFA